MNLPSAGSLYKDRKKKQVWKISLLIICLNICLIVGAGFFITYDFSGRAHSKGQQAAWIANDNKNVQPPIDSLLSSEIAVSLARMSNLETAELIAHQADTHRQGLLVASSDNSAAIQKPLIVETELRSRHDIVHYTTNGDDTVNSLAQKFGVTTNSIRWSNELGFINLLPAGKDLLIPPVNGIVYTVQEDDTVEGLAKKYNSSVEHIVAFNDAEIDGLPVGELIVIPEGEMAAPVRPSYYSSVYGSSGMCGDEDAQTIVSVKRGEQLGIMGTTGRSTGVHLHLAMCDYAGGSYINPNTGVCQRGTDIASSSCDLKYNFGWPVSDRSNNYISRGFTGYHKGLDIVGNNTPIVAVGDGDIIGCGWMGAGGYTVVIRHDNGIITTYMHMTPGSLRC